MRLTCHIPPAELLDIATELFPKSDSIKAIRFIMEKSCGFTDKNTSSFAKLASTTSSPFASGSEDLSQRLNIY